MKDEDYAYEHYRQAQLDNESPELEALKTLQRAVVAMSHHEDPCYHYGFLCTALSSVDHKVSKRQHDFLRQKIHSMLNGSAVLHIKMENNLHHQYLHNEHKFAAMAHAYRMGVIDQWIANQKEKENG